MKKITKEMIKSRLESIGMDKSIAEDLAEIEFRAEKINAANNPAVVPAITRTKAKTTIAVREPTTSGKSIVK